MIRAKIITSWNCTKSDNHPQFADDYPNIGWQDVTGQPVENIEPDPNCYVIEAFIPDEKTLDTIEADTNYFVIESEEVVEDGKII